MAVLAAVAAVALGGVEAHASIPLLYTQLRLDTCCGAAHLGAGRIISGPSGCSTNSTVLGVTLSLDDNADGTAKLVIVDSEGRFTGPVFQTGPQLEMDVTKNSPNATSTWDLTGYGADFTGTASIDLGSGTPGHCVVSKPVHLILSFSLAHTGLTLVTPPPTPSAGPTSSAVPGATVPPAPADVPSWLYQDCWQLQQQLIQNIHASASGLLSAGDATVPVDVGQGGTVTGSVAFDGSGGNGSSIAFPGYGAPSALLADDGGAVSCSNPCIVAFDGSTGQGSSIGLPVPAVEPSSRALLADAGGIVSCPTFDGTGGSGSSISFPVPPSRSLRGPALLAAHVTTAAASTLAPIGTAVATGQATYAAPAHGTLALPLTATGRSILEDVKAADAAYFAAHAGGTSAPFVWLRLTLTFAPAAAASPSSGGAPVPVIVVIIVVLVAALGAGALLRRRRSAGAHEHS